MTANCLESGSETLAPEDRRHTVAKPRRNEQHAFRVTRPRVLIAEDDGEMRRLLAMQLRRAGYQVVECYDGESLVMRLASTFLRNARRNEFDLVISDVRMPGFTGLEVLDGLHEYADCPPIILITAFGDADMHARAEQLGAVAMLDKPFRIDDLVATANETIKHPSDRRPS